MILDDDIVRKIKLLPLSEKADILSLMAELEDSRMREKASGSFLDFVKYLWPEFIEGYHHRVIAQLYDDVLAGKKKRIIVNMPPRHSKSEFASVFLPAYFLGRFPKKKIIQASHTAELAVDFGRKVRNLIDREDFQRVFPKISLSSDSKAAGRWATNKGGEYYAIGVEGKIAGRGADLFVIDDPHSEQDAVLGEHNPEVYDKVMSWYEGGPRQRLQPGGSIIVVMTRWGLRDLTAQLVRKMLANETGDQWEVVEFPALLPSGRPIWPEYWSEEELNKTKASIPITKWNAQYQQQPTAEEGAIIKREYWQEWTAPKLPKFDAIIQSWDTAFTASTRSDYSACTTWGIFYNETVGKNCLFLIDALRGKWEFPDLKTEAHKHYKLHEPDLCIIEGRGAGQPLIYELRRMGLPIHEFTVGRGGVNSRNDKISRINSVTDIFASGNVFCVKEDMKIQEVTEECAAFPAGEHDDYVDTVTMALMRFRSGGWIGTDRDEDEKEEYYPPVHEYY